MGTNLARQVGHRQRWLEKVINFSSDALSKCGQTLHHEVHSCHITATQELKGFHSFSFWSHGAYTMFGGQELKVWFNDTLVLKVEWWDIKELHVQVFDPSPSWRRKLAALAGNPAVVPKWAAARRKNLDKQAAASQSQATRQLEAERLQADAARLHL